jgi:biotin carboxylase
MSLIPLEIRRKLGQLVCILMRKGVLTCEAMKNNVPVVPGTPGPVSDPEHAHAFVEEYGFPVIIKVLNPSYRN